jgi:6-pyruvoyltetrahydropterin/6-carboxytetrahydropterin synthase
MAALLTVKHNIEVAHRLSLTPGKCENIHGHSMIVEFSITGAPDKDTGLLIPNWQVLSEANKTPLEFGELKSWFRDLLDEHLDHRLLLNGADPLIADQDSALWPGLQLFPGEPTTENIAKWIYEAGYRQFIQFELQPIAGRSNLYVTVHETAVNSASYGDNVM